MFQAQKLCLKKKTFCWKDVVVLLKAPRFEIIYMKRKHIQAQLIHEHYITKQKTLVEIFFLF